MVYSRCPGLPTLIVRIEPLRYELGPSLGFSAYPIPPAPEPGRVDLQATIADHSNEGVTLAFDPYDAATTSAPAEARTYYLAEGQAVPATAADWLASSHPVGIHPLDLTSAGGTALIPTPPLQPGKYMIQVLLGYA